MRKIRSVLAAMDLAIEYVKFMVRHKLARTPQAKYRVCRELDAYLDATEEWVNG